MASQYKRPDTWPHEAKFSTIHWESQGYYNYCPRDVLLVIGDQIIETPNVIRSRAQETFSYRTLLIDYMKAGAKWISAPKPMLLDSLFEGVDLDKPTPRNDEPAFDAANVLRFGEDLIYLVSATGNEMGGHWLQSILGDRYRVHFLKDVYYGSHIDSTLVALRPGLVLANPARLNDDTLPKILKQWKVIYSPPMENTDRYDPDYLSMCIGSDWIDMNSFSISPNLVVVDRNQPTLIKTLRARRSGCDSAQAAALKVAWWWPALRDSGRPAKRNVGTVFRLKPIPLEIKLSAGTKNDIECSIATPKRISKSFGRPFTTGIHFSN